MTTICQMPEAPAPAKHIGLTPASSLKSAMPGADYRMVTARSLPLLAEKIRNATTPIAVDTETTGLSPYADRLCGISVCLAPGEAYYLPVAGIGHTLPLADVVAALAPAMEHAPIIGHHLAFDLAFLMPAGFTFANIVGDTLIFARLLDPNRRRKHGLDDLAGYLLDAKKIPTEKLLGKRARDNTKTFDAVPTDDATVYACEDVDATLRIFGLLLPRIAERGLADVLQQEIALLPVVVAMEARGIMVDRKALRKLKNQYIGQAADGQKIVDDIAGRPVNLNSTAQLGVLLFDQLGLPIRVLTKTGKPAVNKAALAMLSASGPVPAAILANRNAQKMLSTFVRPLHRYAHAQGGRVHGRFNSTGTATGRFSSSKPDMQNIPSRGAAGKAMRACVVAPHGRLLNCCDYSQIELRCMAHMSKCPVMIDAFLTGKNFHLATAAAMYGKPEAEVSADEKAAAKIVNFGMPYGMGAYRLAIMLQKTEEEAQNYINKYFAAYPAVKAYRDRMIKKAKADGGVRTALGRFRPLPGLRRYGREYYADERRVLNTIIQGSCAELLKAAMLAIDARVHAENLPLELIATIHDELLFEAPAERAEEMLAIVKHEMESVWQWAVPIVAEGHVGMNWAEAK